MKYNILISSVEDASFIFQRELNLSVLQPYLLSMSLTQAVAENIGDEKMDAMFEECLGK
jgi:hypothetical protein